MAESKRQSERVVWKVSNVYYSELVVNDLDLELVRDGNNVLEELYKDRLANKLSESIKNEMKFVFIDGPLQHKKVARAEVAIIPVEEYFRLKEIEKMAETIFRRSPND